jgi:hypothetical protein
MKVLKFFVTIREDEVIKLAAKEYKVLGKISNELVAELTLIVDSIADRIENRYDKNMDPDLKTALHDTKLQAKKYIEKLGKGIAKPSHEKKLIDTVKEMEKLMS